MGYTRYWKRTGKIITQDFLDAVNEILADCEQRGIIIKGWDGEGEPEVTLGRVAFNGNAETELDHESFVIDNIKDNFCFCKTARKPYDYAVRKALKVAKEMELVTNVRSDGRNEKIVSDSEYLHEEIEAISNLKRNASLFRNELKIGFDHKSYLYFKTWKDNVSDAFDEFLELAEGIGCILDNMEVTELVLRDIEGNDIQTIEGGRP